MNKIKCLSIITLLLTLTMLTQVRTIKANSTTIYVDPKFTTVEIFQTTQINISISQVVDLAAWDFKLYYPNSILNATQITEGPFLKKANSTFFMIKEFNDNYNTTHGRIWAACVLIGQGPGANGDGTLATITFKAKSAGNATIHLAETKLLDSKPDPGQIPHTTMDGTIKVSGHDIAVLNVNPLKTIVGQGYTMNINVTVANQGDFTETFNITLYANTTAIQTRQATLAKKASTTLTYTWNTTGFAKGNYTIWAYAWPVQGETDTEDNTLFDGIVYVGVPCDVSGPTLGVPDGVCNMRDIGYMCSKFGTTPSSPNWNPNCDVTGPTPKTPDNIVNMRDIGEACRNFGKTDP